MLFFRYNELFQAIDYIIPVPSHWTRIIKRGYNTASLIASELSKIAQIPMYSGLKRIKRTSTQKNKTLKERFENVQNAFQVKNNKKLENKSIMLVDDVFTSGATLNSCSETLKQLNTRKITCITIATV